MKKPYLVILSYVDADLEAAQSIHFVLWTESIQGAHQAAQAGCRSPGWVAQAIAGSSGAVPAADLPGEFDHLAVVPLEQPISQPLGAAGLGQLSPEKAHRLGMMVQEYGINAVIASLKLGGPECIGDVIFDETDNEALDNDLDITWTRGFVHGIANGLDLRLGEVLEFLPEPAIDWRRFSQGLLDDINVARAGRGLPSLPVPGPQVYAGALT